MILKLRGAGKFVERGSVPADMKIFLHFKLDVGGSLGPLRCPS